MISTNKSRLAKLYLTALERAERGEWTISTDEMTGIQVLERTSFDNPMRPGLVQRREFEYIRHGTQSLISRVDIVRGQSREIWDLEEHGLSRSLFDRFESPNRLLLHTKTLFPEATQMSMRILHDLRNWG